MGSKKRSVLFYVKIVLLLVLLQIGRSTVQAQTDSVPAPRSGHSMVKVDSLIYIFGGEGDSSKSGPVFKDLWRFNENNDEFEMENPIEEPLPARKGHAAAVIGRKMYILFGEGESDLLDDVWAYDLDGTFWESCTSWGATTPAARKNATATPHAGGIYFIGGENADGYSFYESWNYNTTTGEWTRLTDPPDNKAGHAAAIFDGNLYTIYGRSNPGRFSTGVHFFNLVDTWSFVAYTTGTPPGPRGYFGWAYNTTSMYMFGGEDGFRSTALSTNFKFTIADSSWTTLISGPALSHSAAVWMNDTSIYIFGGKNSMGEVTNIMWRYDPSEDSFEEVLVGIEEQHQLPDKLSISCYPNPFNSNLKISVAGFELMVASYEFFDINGRLVKEFNQSRIGEFVYPGSPDCRITGSPSIVWQPTESLSSGIYFVRVKLGEKRITNRVVYLK